jgi:hypothetical protein
MQKVMQMNKLSSIRDVYFTSQASREESLKMGTGPRMGLETK